MIEKINTIKDIFEDLDMLTEQQETWFDDAIEQGMLQGLQQGLQKGRQEGLQEGETKILIRQLTYRFGPLPQWARVRLNAADSAQLEAWCEALFSAHSLTDVLGPAEGH